MKPTGNLLEIRSILQKFQDGYITRNVANLDAFMQLFLQDESIEMIGIGAAKRAANEWFDGLQRSWRTNNEGFGLSK